MPTKIEWTDETWNPVTGCTKVSAGCKNCYAERIAKRFWGERKFTDVRCHPERLSKPQHWRKPRMVFVNSMSDLFHEDIPVEFVGRVLNTIGSNSKHIFQVLTKRPERAKKILDVYYDMFAEPFPNLWLGVTCENQKIADERIEILLQTPAATRFVSCEPLLEEINLRHYLHGMPEAFGDFDDPQWQQTHPPLDWVICGGESGHGARHMLLSWADSLLNQCRGASVPFFMKQLGSSHMGWNSKGDKLKYIPEYLRVREYP